MDWFPLRSISIQYLFQSSCSVQSDSCQRTRLSREDITKHPQVVHGIHVQITALQVHLTCHSCVVTTAYDVLDIIKSKLFYDASFETKGHLRFKWISLRCESIMMLNLCYIRWQCWLHYVKPGQTNSWFWLGLNIP